MYKIYQGHILDNISQLRNNSIDLIITSPPYWGLRNYGDDTNVVKWSDGWTGQLGLEPDYKSFVEHIVEIFNELKRKLKDTGSLWVNFGDTYSGGGGIGVNQTIENITKRSTEWKNYEKYPDGTPQSKLRGIMGKSKLFIPERFAIAMVDSGWLCRNEIIWHKPSCMPSSAKDRFTVDFEKFFFFTKQEKYFFKQQFETMKNSSKTRMDKGFEVYPREWSNPNSPLAGGKKINIKYNEEGRNMRAVWSINPKGYKKAHFATYPEKLISVPIDACCEVGGIVLDPFSGSGTSGVVALKQNKRYIGIEINPEYVLMSEERLEGVHTLYKSKRTQKKDFL